MELLLARKGIHYFFLTDHNSAPVQYAFTDTMIANNLFIEFREALLEVEIVEDESADEEDDVEDDDELDQDTPSHRSEPIKNDIEKFEETSITVSAIINNEGMDYFIFTQPEVPVSKMVLFRIIVDLAEVLDHCPVGQLHDYLDAASTSHFSAKQVKQFNRKSTLTRDTLKRITQLRQLRDQKNRDKQ